MAYVIYGSKEGPGPYIWFPERNLMIPIGGPGRFQAFETPTRAGAWARSGEPPPSTRSEPSR